MSRRRGKAPPRAAPRPVIPDRERSSLGVVVYSADREAIAAWRRDAAHAVALARLLRAAWEASRFMGVALA